MQVEAARGSVGRRCGLVCVAAIPRRRPALSALPLQQRNICMQGDMQNSSSRGQQLGRGQRRRWHRRRPAAAHLVLAQLGLHELLIEHRSGGEVRGRVAHQGGLQAGAEAWRVVV
jgi:hypothetical protein